jgi:hypothetical protein
MTLVLSEVLCREKVDWWLFLVILWMCGCMKGDTVRPITHSQYVFKQKVAGGRN